MRERGQSSIWSFARATGSEELKLSVCQNCRVFTRYWMKIVMSLVLFYSIHVVNLLFKMVRSREHHVTELEPKLIGCKDDFGYSTTRKFVVEDIVNSGQKMAEEALFLVK